MLATNLACMRAERKRREAASSAETIQHVEVGVDVVQPIREWRVLGLVPLIWGWHADRRVMWVGLALVIHAVKRSHLITAKRPDCE